MQYSNPSIRFCLHKAFNDRNPSSSRHGRHWPTTDPRYPERFPSSHLDWIFQFHPTAQEMSLLSLNLEPRACSQVILQASGIQSNPSKVAPNAFQVSDLMVDQLRTVRGYDAPPKATEKNKGEHGRSISTETVIRNGSWFFSSLAKQPVTSNPTLFAEPSGPKPVLTIKQAFSTFGLSSTWGACSCLCIFVK